VFTAIRVGYGLVVINHVSLGISLLCRNKLSNTNMSCLSLSTLGGYERFTLGGRDTLRKVGPHDIKRSPVLASDRNFTGYVMGLHSGVTPLGINP